MADFTPEAQRPTTRIRGWFAFLLFSVLMGGVISLGMGIRDFDAETYALSPVLGTADLVASVVLLGVSWWAAIRTWCRKPDALFFIRAYLALVFIYDFITLAVNGFSLEGLSRFEAKFLLRSLVWSVVWIVYTVKSRHVAEVLPKTMRRTSPWAVMAVVFLAVLPFAQMGWGILELQVRGEEWELPEFVEADLEPGFCTDGHVIFRRPQDATVELEETSDEESGELVVSCILEGLGEDPWRGAVTSLIYSGDSEEQFEDQRKAFEPEELEHLEKRLESREDRVSDGRTTRLRVVSAKLADGSTMYWRYAMIFDRKTRKTAILHFCDRSFDGRYFTSLVDTVRFTNP